ncbi:MAG: metalloregulator ArsR/SmtB family transcription factor [candidate division KSB1 bacterium]|nr:metalloregulator ArsR/SmtB family transcription factor [candidate division KSB1 bacterium]
MRDISKLFKAIADNTRLRILWILKARPLCVCEIREVLQLAISTVSQHLSILRDAGFIVDIKEGKWVNYARNPDPNAEEVQTLLALIDRIMEREPSAKIDRQAAANVDRNAICSIENPKTAIS